MKALNMWIGWQNFHFRQNNSFLFFFFVIHFLREEHLDYLGRERGQQAARVP